MKMPKLREIGRSRNGSTATIRKRINKEAEASRLIIYFSTLCAEQRQLRISCGWWPWRARRLEITDRAVVTFGKQKRVNILNRTSEEFKNRPLQ